QTCALPISVAVTEDGGRFRGCQRLAGGKEFVHTVEPVAGVAFFHLPQIFLIGAVSVALEMVGADDEVAAGFGGVDAELAGRHLYKGCLPVCRAANEYGFGYEYRPLCSNADG